MHAPRRSTSITASAPTARPGAPRPPGRAGARPERGRHPGEAALDLVVARGEELGDPAGGLDLLEPQLGVGVEIAGEPGQRRGLGVDGVIDGSSELRVE